MKVKSRAEYKNDYFGYIVCEKKYRHASMVSLITEILTRKLGWAPGASAQARDAALLHDIGKNFIPQEILNRQGRLTNEEYALVKTHAEPGYEYLMSQANNCSSMEWEPEVILIAALLAAQHHERIDGSGYAGLKGADIHPLAKIVALADVFDALSSRRPYKEPWSAARINAYLLEGRGILFEAKYVDLLLGCYEEILSLYKASATFENYTEKP